ncbi:hypothetical protein DL98DRAFT_581380 [Cadophora sp. DSE1049]|nr:hypothetical protein DL98DRAFT_581380 [Cadophora sp. DSE1049]
MAHTKSTEHDAPAHQPTIFLIRHGEKPPKINGKDQDGLSAQGEQRATGLVNVFGKNSLFDIGYILAQHPKKDGSRARPHQTVLPIATSLGLKVDTSIDRDSYAKVAKAATHFKGPGNVLICWEHKALTDIVREIGVLKEWVYPSRFDIIWAVKPPYDVLEVVGSEGIAGLDDGIGGVGPVVGIEDEIGEVGGKGDGEEVGVGLMQTNIAIN